MDFDINGFLSPGNTYVYMHVCMYVCIFVTWHAFYATRRKVVVQNVNRF